MDSTLLDACRQIQAISQSGLAFSKDPYDQERFQQLKAIASDLVAAHTSHSKEYIERIFSAEAGYATPKLDVRGAVFREGRILMVREKSTQRWTLPGGYVDVGESLSESVQRELLEEAGLVVRARKVAGLFDHRKHGYKPHLYHFYKIYLLCDLLGGELGPKTNIEVSEVAFFSESELEALELDPGRVARAHILRMFEHARSPLLPTDFD
jgi:ADP-ribose pyrophosphatase YjhB (NUDIX family)